MKIAYLANIRFPSERAHSVQIDQMCKAFSANACFLDLYVSGKKSKTSSQGKFNGYRIIKSFSGFYHYDIKSSFYLSELIFSLSFFIQSIGKKYNLIFSRSEWIIYFMTFLVKSENLVWESHEAKLNFPARSILKRGIKVVVISNGIKEVYSVQPFCRSRLLVAVDAVDESFFGSLQERLDVRKRLGISQNVFVAMYIGGFDEWKGVNVFFEASNQLPDVCFVAIGGTKVEVKEFSGRFKNVHFLGQMPYEQLKDNQRAADILVIPNTAKNTLSSSYTSPLKLFAHMASGVPIIASNVQSIKSVLSEDFATYFTPDEPTSLALAISTVLSEYELKSKKAKDLVAVSRRFTWDSRAKQILGFVGYTGKS